MSNQRSGGQNPNQNPNQNQNLNREIRQVFIDTRIRNFIGQVVQNGIQRENNNMTNYMRIVGRLNERDALERALNLSYNTGLQEANEKKKKLSEEEYKNKIIVRNSKKTDRDPKISCSICQEGYNTHKIAKLPCGHEFHNKCCSKWLKKYGSDCPLCKAPVV